MKLKKNKRGDLLSEETLKIIIALICIVFLLYILYSIYDRITTDKDLAFAKESLDKISSGFENKITEIEIFNPADAWIVAWPDDKNEKPNSCENTGWENCLCICKKSKLSLFNEIFLGQTETASFLKDCSNWECRQTESKINIVHSGSSYGIKIANSPTILELNYKDGIKISAQ